MISNSCNSKRQEEMYFGFGFSIKNIVYLNYIFKNVIVQEKWQFQLYECAKCTKSAVLSV